MVRRARKVRINILRIRQNLVHLPRDWCSQVSVPAHFSMTKKHLGILKKTAVQARPPSLKQKKPNLAKPAQSQPKPAAGKPTAGGSKQKATAAAAALLQSKTEKYEQQQQREWIPHSPVVRYAAEAVAKLIAADASQQSGKSIKSLTLAPHVSTKKATYALTCQTLRCKYRWDALPYISS